MTPTLAAPLQPQSCKRLRGVASASGKLAAFRSHAKIRPRSYHALENWADGVVKLTGYALAVNVVPAGQGDCGRGFIGKCRGGGPDSVTAAHLNERTQNFRPPLAPPSCRKGRARSVFGTRPSAFRAS